VTAAERIVAYEALVTAVHELPQASAIGDEEGSRAFGIRSTGLRSGWRSPEADGNLTDEGTPVIAEVFYICVVQRLRLAVRREPNRIALASR
jgi:hypothetical protein